MPTVVSQNVMQSLWKKRTLHDKFVDWVVHKINKCDWICPYCLGKRTTRQLVEAADVE